MSEHRAVKTVIIVLVLVFAFHQIYSSVYKPITTQSAEYYEAVDGITCTGFIVRNETIITNDSGGVLHFVIPDGERVAKNGAVADIYGSTDASVTVSRINEINGRIADIEEMQGYNGVEAADLSLASSKVSEALSSLINGCAFGNYSDAQDLSDQLLSALNRRQMITGEQSDFNLQLEALKSELAALTANLPAATGSVRAPVSGYFVSDTDGYENVLLCDNLGRITPEFLDNISAVDVPENAIGKIVSDYEWYIAASVSINDSLRYKEGDELTVMTNLKGNTRLSVTVSKINISSESDRATVIFSCQQMSSELASMRMGTFTIVSNVYTGLRIPQKALRVLDGTTGVYVLSGITLKFVPVNVIYRFGDDIICEQVQSNDNVLRLYDEVVVKGKKLYEGKVVG